MIVQTHGVLLFQTECFTKAGYFDCYCQFPYLLYILTGNLLKKHL